jgi:hypothetical protein
VLQARARVGELIGSFCSWTALGRLCLRSGDAWLSDRRPGGAGKASGITVHSIEIQSMELHDIEVMEDSVAGQVWPQYLLSFEAFCGDNKLLGSIAVRGGFAAGRLLRVAGGANAAELRWDGHSLLRGWVTR